MTAVSIIIPTYNGAGKIPVLMEALKKQTLTEFEVVVVVDGSTDNTVDVISGFCDDFKALRVIDQENSGRAGAKNRGAFESVGDLLVFYDDDMSPAPDSLQKHVDFHSHENANCLLGGNPVDQTGPLSTDFQKYKAWLSSEWMAKFQENQTRLDFDNLFFSAANCSMPRTLFEQLGGFDARLTDAEDYDLAYRALENGVSVCFDRSNIAAHCEAITCASFIRRQRQYGDAQVMLARFNPGRPNQRPLTPFWKRAVYRFFAFCFFPHIIDNTRAFSLLPLRVRYLLYSIVVHALSREYPKVSCR